MSNFSLETKRGIIECQEVETSCETSLIIELWKEDVGGLLDNFRLRDFRSLRIWMNST